MTSELFTMFVRILRIQACRCDRHRSRFDFHKRFENVIFTCEEFALLVARSQERSEELQDLLRREKRLI